MMRYCLATCGKIVCSTMATMWKLSGQFKEDKGTMDRLRIADKEFTSRLIVGTARYPNPDVMLQAIEASGAEMITVSVRRHNLEDTSAYSILGMLKQGS